MIPLPDEVAQVKPNNAAITITLFHPWKKTSKTITSLDLASVGTCPILKPQSFLKGFRFGNPIFLTGSLSLQKRWLVGFAGPLVAWR